MAAEFAPLLLGRVRACGAFSPWRPAKIKNDPMHASYLNKSGLCTVSVSVIFTRKINFVRGLHSLSS